MRMAGFQFREELQTHLIYSATLCLKHKLPLQKLIHMNALFFRRFNAIEASQRSVQ